MLACGTPYYVSPEILDGQGYDGRRADIWSMGVCLFVMTTGTLPFRAKSLPDLFTMIREGNYKSLPSGLSSSFIDLISKILVIDPSKRLTLREIQQHEWMLDDDWAAYLTSSKRRIIGLTKLRLGYYNFIYTSRCGTPLWRRRMTVTLFGMWYSLFIQYYYEYLHKLDHDNLGTLLQELLSDMFNLCGLFLIAADVRRYTTKMSSSPCTASVMVG